MRPGSHSGAGGRHEAASLAAHVGGREEIARLIVYLTALTGVMVLIVASLVTVAALQRNPYWLLVAAPFGAEILVVVVTRAFLTRDRPTAAALTFIWGSLTAILPFVVLFPAAYPASVVAVAQIQAVGLGYLRGTALRATLAATTLGAGAVAALGAALGPWGGPVEKLAIATIVLLAFALLSLVHGQNQDRLSRALSETERARDTLEVRVAERTAELTETAHRLEAAKSAAEAAVNAKSAFLAHMSHELRTPLNSILGFAELLEDDVNALDRETHARYVRTIHESGTHLLTLINDLLDLAKVQAGQLELHREQCAVSELVAHAVATLQPLADRKQIRLDTLLDMTAHAEADAGKITQIVLNLLSNAIKFTPEHGRVVVEVRRSVAVIQVTVSDTGIGIAAEDHPRIFEEFQQIDTDRARRQQGTGLGLALSKRLVELHGGRIWFESAPGRGSTFHFTLPLSAEPDALDSDRGAEANVQGFRRAG